MRRGEIWVGNLNPNRGTEVGKVRPVLIIQADPYTHEGSPSVIILPISSKLPDANPLHVKIVARDKLLQDSMVLVEHPRTLDRKRFGDGPLTRITNEEMVAVEKRLMAVLGMY